MDAQGGESIWKLLEGIVLIQRQLKTVNLGPLVPAWSTQTDIFCNLQKDSKAVTLVNTLLLLWRVYYSLLFEIADSLQESFPC